MREWTWPARPERDRPAVRALPRPAEAAERLARLHAELRGVRARRERVEREYAAGRLSRDEYAALAEELRGCLYALGLALYDIHAASA